MDSEANTNNPSRDKLLKLNQNLKQLEFINQLELHLSGKKGYCKIILSELNQIKAFTQINTIKALKDIKKNDKAS